LYLTGQDILFCGVASAMMSGVMTATSVLGAASVKVLPEFLGDKKANGLAGCRQAAPGGRKPLPGGGQCTQAGPARPGAAQLVARCTEVLDVTADVKAFRFVDDAGHPMDYKPGQFVTLELEWLAKSLPLVHHVFHTH
jgi:hypothetical protein